MTSINEEGIASEVKEPKIFEKDFTVCTLMTNAGQYKRAIASFKKLGFNEKNTKFLYVDNTKEPQVEAFSGLNMMLSHANSTYVILCHQDIELVADSAENLLEKLKNLTVSSPNWAVVGNAGRRGRFAPRHISDLHGKNQFFGPLPAQVDSLDENFLVIRSESQVSFSNGLSGFHLYGTDICLQARLKGHTAHVIDFHLFHHSAGKIDKSFFSCVAKFEERYSQELGRQRIQTTAHELFLMPSLLEKIFWYPRRTLKWHKLKKYAANQHGAFKNT
jgi:hypothetical protein